ncbi:MAG: protein BatD [Gammaproteobacteria bacterium]|nr:protein BatD [Gammaproteobacteria bacterium]
MVKHRKQKSFFAINTNGKYTAKKTLLVTLILFSTLFVTVTQAANITVTTSRNPVALDDSFHLIYEADSSVDDDPDFSPIYKNFDILSSSQSTNMRSVNGSWDLKRSWNLTLIAKGIGNFVVPAIRFGKDTSPAIRLKITNNTSANGTATIPAKIFLENSIDKKTGWIQSQFIYTVKLLRTVNIANATITEPVISDPDAIIEQLSEDKYQTTRKGIRYEVFERRYAIFPQKSGTLKINPVTFEGRINATQSRSLFDQFRISGQLKRLRSKAINVTIKATPSNINLQDWLPATGLRLIEEWSDDIQNIKAGEPVTRTILIATEGLTGIQLPDLTFDEINGLKQYPDKAIIDDKKTASGITGYKQIKIALIPAKKGNYTLPEIKLSWWNTKTNKQEIAVLPQVHLNVTGSVLTDNTNIQANTDNLMPSDKNSPLAKTQTTNTISFNENTYWKWLSLLLALAWFITLVLFFKKNKITKKDIQEKSSSLSIKQAARDVVKQAKKNDPAKTKTVLLHWARIIYNDSTLTSLTMLSTHCSPTLSDEIRQLNKSLYSAKQNTWQNDNFINAFNNEMTYADKNKEKKLSSLKPLYDNQL